MRCKRALAALLTAVALAIIVGCQGATTSEVSGTVSYDGKPVERGTITFWSEDGNSTGGGVIQDGRYVARSVPIGPTVVVIIGDKVTEKKNLYGPGGPQGELTANYLPARYCEKEKSELKYEVK